MSLGPLYVLAGGMATRLGALGAKRPKYLMDVGRGRVFADVHLDWAKQQGFVEVILCVGNLSEQIQEHCKDGSQWGLKVSYAFDGPTRLGTGGALYQAWTKRKDPIFCLTYGDTLLSLNAQECVECLSENTHAEALMTVFRNSVEGHESNVALDPPWALYNKTHPPLGAEFIDYGFLAFKDVFMSRMSGSAQDLAEPLSGCAAQRKLLSFEVAERFWEIGSPEALEEFQRKLST